MFFIEIFFVSILCHLKGLSHETDLAFDDMHGQLLAYIGDAASF